MSACEHCGTALSPTQARFCCVGCKAVHGILGAAGLERYYDLRDAPPAPVGDAPPEPTDLAWLEPIEASLAGGGWHRVVFDVAGLRCTACVWLLETLFERGVGAGEIVVNPAVGRVSMRVTSRFALRSYVRSLEELGYRVGPRRKEHEPERDALLIRMGICLALALNAMTFSIAIYLGLDDGVLYTLFTHANFALALGALLLGGPVFFAGAWRGLRRGVIHLDVPISLGIVLSFAGSTWSLYVAGSSSAYFDSVAVFIALMLVGRWLTERVVANNRSRLLDPEHAGALLSRRLEGRSVELVPCARLRPGDRLLIAKNDLVPLRSELSSDEAAWSLAWTTGESEPRTLVRGDDVPAGAIYLGARSIHVVVRETLEDSALPALLLPSERRDRAGAGSSFFWRVLSGSWAIFVLATASIGGAAWWAAGDSTRAIEVMVAVLVVTCPCAFGIATPLAYELAHSTLRRAGVFVRRADLLDRVREVTTVVFDKTGTLTTGTLTVADLAPLDALPTQGRSILYTLAAQSSHPKSDAIRRALSGRASFEEDIVTTEHPGLGIQAQIGGERHRLGASEWAIGGPSDAGDVVYAVDGEARAVLRTRETPRHGAKEEVAALEARGLSTWVLSGDDPAATCSLGSTLGLGEERVLGGLGPDDKASWIRSNRPEHVMMLGDGVNDGPAFDAAHCSGTPVIDRPFLPARADFFLTHPGILPVAKVLEEADRLSRVVRRNLLFAIVYNVLAVGAAWAGFMQPWMAAVLMPLSSLAVLAHTRLSYSSRAQNPKTRRIPWKSSSYSSS